MPGLPIIDNGRNKVRVGLVVGVRVIVAVHVPRVVAVVLRVYSHLQ